MICVSSCHDYSVVPLQRNMHDLCVFMPLLQTVVGQRFAGNGPNGLSYYYYYYYSVVPLQR